MNELEKKEHQSSWVERLVTPKPPPSNLGRQTMLSIFIQLPDNSFLEALECNIEKWSWRRE